MIDPDVKIEEELTVSWKEEVSCLPRGQHIPEAGGI